MCFKWHRERVTNTKYREEKLSGICDSSGIEESMCFKWHRERVTNTKDREEQSNGASASGERSSYHSWSRSKCHSVATAHLSSCGGGTTEAGVAFCCT